MSNGTFGGSVEAGIGLSTVVPDPLRYSGQTDAPYESTALLIAATPTGSRVLDVGCGTGSVTRRIRERCRAEVIGIEPSPERAQAAIASGLVVHQDGFPSTLLPPDGTFDVVLFADVLEHLVDPGGALAAARAYLRPGGYIVASIPNVAHWTVRVELLRGRFDYYKWGIMDATHLRWFTETSARRLFYAAGFDVEFYSASAGTELEDYTTYGPWRWLSPKTRVRVIVPLAKRWPRLFGCQHIIRAKMR